MIYLHELVWMLLGFQGNLYTLSNGRESDNFVQAR